MSRYFISDLHLTPARPDSLALFHRFLRREACGAEAVYILGDLFEVWLGDDAVDPGYHAVLKAMSAVADAGTPLYVMRGNRDFLLGEGFARASGARLIDDPWFLDIGASRAMLVHGDALCTDDIEYQRFRTMVRRPETQAQFLGLPVAKRQAIAAGYRDASRAHTRMKPSDIMDVNADAVVHTMTDAGVTLLIHGHTHRPAIHHFSLHDGEAATRVVLGDWHESAMVLRETGGHIQLEEFA
ncbi:MAG TPA: UDP-2,3-diacylglucosamine diphosphatase [Gammaproteobacteria bacterium]|nr:UDP-2,3-diacylglucosamine diphosphatase [Gammaproteobacteria bacterium]